MKKILEIVSGLFGYEISKKGTCDALIIRSINAELALLKIELAAVRERISNLVEE